MKHLIQHLVSQHLDEIAAKSLAHCHVHGLHSVMLLDAPEHRIRLYVTAPDHMLWRNGLASWIRQDETLAAHAHHCALTLDVIYGRLTNIAFEPSALGKHMPYLYQSAILNGIGGFTHPALGSYPNLAVKDFRVYSNGMAVTMPAHEIHTVQVERGHVCGWLVYEGKEDPAYEPISWATHDLTKWNSDGLYQPMTPADVLRVLESVGLQ